MIYYKKPVRKSIVFLCILLALAIAAALWFFLRPAGQNAFFDTNAVRGNLPTKSKEEIQAELNRVVEESMFNISIAPVIMFADGKAEGQARIENIMANRYHMSVRITRDDTSETVYESKGIAPGMYIEYITLSENLPKGEYKATSTFTAYDTDTFAAVGQAAAKITIVVDS